jgi:peptide/nickel transport system ATP-binding protein
MRSEENVLLRMEDVTVRLDLASRKSVEVLQNIDLAIAPGRTLGLIGESGAGKSMIGRAITNSLPEGFSVSQGRILLGEEDITRMSEESRRRLLGKEISFIPQDPQSALNPVMSVGEHFAEHLSRLGRKGGDWRSEAEAMLASVHIADPALVLRKYAHELSGGMCQRILIAMAFAAHPRLLIADEATTALDPISQANIVRLLKDMQRDHGTAVIFITHDLRLASHVCDEVLVMFGGQPLEFGDARTVIAAPAHPYTLSLRNSIPSLDGELMRLPDLPEWLPSLRSFRMLKGCRYAPRSTHVDPSYPDANPPRRMVGDNHWVRWADDGLEGSGAARVEPLEQVHDSAREPLLLSVRGIGKVFTRKSGWRGPVRQTVAADDISFDLKRGDILGLVGLSGSGKSTVARILVGLETPDTGSIRLDERELTEHDDATAALRRRGIQMVFQNAQLALNPRRTVGSLVTQAHDGLAGSLPPDQRRAKAVSLLRMVGLPADFVDRYPGQLSGGQRQRVGIARALCVEPKVIVADEIVSGLDVSVQAQVLNLLRELRDRTGIAVIFISHDLSAVRYLCDRLVVMRMGKIEEAGETGRLLKSSTNAYTRELIASIPPEEPDAPWMVGGSNIGQMAGNAMGGRA